MSMYLLKSIVLIFSILITCGASAQDTTDDREVIIIEKTIDEDGNVISKKIRRNQGKLSEEDLNRMLEEEDDLPFLRSFDLEGMGFDGAFGNFFNPNPSNSKPRLGVMIDPSSGYAEVTEVQRGSGAADADIRNGDRILVVRGESVANVEDIAAALDGKKNGDLVRIKILRDGEELEKEVKLSGSKVARSGDQFFDLPMDMNFGFWGDSDEGSAMMDSLLERMRGMNLRGFDFDGFDMDRMLENRKPSNRLNSNNNERPQLGLLIDQEGSNIIVSEVLEEGSADHSGIEVGDVIKRFDDNQVGSFRELRAMMNTKSLGDEVILTIDQNGKEKEIRILLK